MSDEVEEEEEGGGGKKKILFIVGALVVAGAVYNFVLKPAPTPEEIAMQEEAAAIEAQRLEEEEAAKELIDGEIVQLDEMILNIRGETPGFMKISVAIVLDDETLLADFEPKIAIAQDQAVQYLSARPKEQMMTPQGQQAAKDELGALIREAYGDTMVKRVLFTDLVIQ